MLTIFSYQRNVSILLTSPANRYSYHAPGLFVPYILANVFTLVTVIIGLYSYIYDDVMPDKKFQDIVSAAEDPTIVHVVRERKRSVTAVMVDGKLMLRAGPESGKEVVGRKVRRVWGRVGRSKARKHSRTNEPHKKSERSDENV